jgi:hypothetical protein
MREAAGSIAVLLALVLFGFMGCEKPMPKTVPGETALGEIAGKASGLGAPLRDFDSGSVRSETTRDPCAQAGQGDLH